MRIQTNNSCAINNDVGSNYESMAKGNVNCNEIEFDPAQTKIDLQDVIEGTHMMAVSDSAGDKAALLKALARAILSGVQEEIERIKKLLEQFGV